MKKLFNLSLKKFIIYAGIVLVCSIPAYYFAISKLWRYEMDEHNIIVTPEAGREDSFLIIGAVTLLTVFFFILLLGGFILLNRSISRQLWQPFYQSLAQIKNFDLARQKEITFDTTNIAEFAELNQSLDKLIAGSISAYNQQKEFADNASHELQTPLAIVQSKLELLSQSDTLTSDQYAIIEETLHALSRVTRINKNLLLLTKIENSQFMDKEVINVTDLLSHTVSLSGDFSEGKQLTLQTHLAPGVTMEGNKILVEILFNNLLTNAIRHSQPNGTVSIQLSKKNLVISNPGNTPLQPDKLFRRFAHTTLNSPGTGLGLALVKQICSRYGWKIHYSFGERMHVFSLAF